MSKALAETELLRERRYVSNSKNNWRREPNFDVMVFRKTKMQFRTEICIELFTRQKSK